MTSHIEQSKVGIIGVPAKAGQRRDGVNKAPKALREAGLIEGLTELDVKVTDHGDIETPVLNQEKHVFGANNPHVVGGYCKLLSEKVAQSKNDLELVLGGDHSIAIGSIAGHCKKQEKRPCVIWVDAHCDLNPPTCSTTANMHGMPLSFLIHEFKEYIPEMPGFEWLEPCIHAKDVVYIGVRDVDTAERYFVKKFGMHEFSMHEVDKYGIREVVRLAIKAVNPDLDRPIHLSFDVDGMDPTVTPSTGTPVMGGLTYREGMYIVEEIAKTGQLSVMDIVEVNTNLGTEAEQKKTVKVAIDLARAACGSYRGGNVPRGYSVPIPDVADFENNLNITISEPLNDKDSEPEKEGNQSEKEEKDQSEKEKSDPSKNPENVENEVISTV